MRFCDRLGELLDTLIKELISYIHVLKQIILQLCQPDSESISNVCEI